MAVEDLKTAQAAGVDAMIISDLKTVKTRHLADLKAAEKDRVEATEGFSPFMQTLSLLNPAPTGTSQIGIFEGL
jgi:hypothetical protein